MFTKTLKPSAIAPVLFEVEYHVLQWDELLRTDLNPFPMVHFQLNIAYFNINKTYVLSL